MTTTTPYSDGWVAAHSGKTRENYQYKSFTYQQFIDEWCKGYDDAKAGQIDAQAFLGQYFVESKQKNTV